MTKSISHSLLNKNYDITTNILTYSTHGEMSVTGTVSKFFKACTSAAARDQFREYLEHKKIDVGTLRKFQKLTHCNSLAKLLALFPRNTKEVEECDASQLVKARIDLSQFFQSFPNLTTVTIPMRYPNKTHIALPFLELCNSKNVKRIKMVDYDAEDPVLIGKIMQKFPLQELFSANLDGVSDEMIKAYVDKYKTYLTDVNIFGDLSERGEALIYLFQNCPNLLSVRLTHCSSRLLQEIGTHCPSLRSISFSTDDAAIDEGIQTLAEGCKDLTCFELVDIKEPRHEDDDDNEEEDDRLTLSESLVSLAENCKNLSTLTLSVREGILDADLEILARGCQKLTEINFSETPIDDDDLYAMSLHLPQLVSINLEKTRVTNKGINALLRTCPRLIKVKKEKLDLHEFNIVRQILRDKTNAGALWLQRELEYKPKTLLGESYSKAFRDVVLDPTINLNSQLDRDVPIYLNLFHAKVSALVGLRMLILSKYAALRARESESVNKKSGWTETQLEWLWQIVEELIEPVSDSPHPCPLSFNLCKTHEEIRYAPFGPLADALQI